MLRFIHVVSCTVVLFYCWVLLHFSNMLLFIFCVFLFNSIDPYIFVLLSALGYYIKVGLHIPVNVFVDVYFNFF